MKRKLWLLIGVFCIAFLLCAAKNPEASESESNENLIVGIGNLEFFSQKGSYIVYFGRPTCIECVKLEPVLLDYLESAGTKVYYFNTDYWKDDPKFEDILSEYQVDSVPMLIKIKSGNYDDKYIPDVSLSEDELKESLDKFFHKQEGEPMTFELVNTTGHPVQFTNYFETFTFFLMAFNCICMIRAYRTRHTKEGCVLRLLINATIIFVLHIVICGFGLQYAMWIEAEPSTHLFAQIGMMTWLFVTPLLYVATILFFILITAAKRRRIRNLDNHT